MLTIYEYRQQLRQLFMNIVDVHLRHLRDKGNRNHTPQLS